jgi:hypothetical protein
MKQVRRTVKEYNKLSISKKESWIKQKQKEIDILKIENNEYRKQHDDGRYDYDERLERLFRTLHMSTEYPYRYRK